mgnify:CR=1 FL=1
MKRYVTGMGIVVLMGFVCRTATATVPGSAITGVDNDVTGTFSQNTSLIGGGDAFATGGNSDSSSSSSAVASGGQSNSNSEGGNGYSILEFSPSSTTNYKTKTPPIGAMAPYLPLWTHAGWGTIKGYFSNGPTADDTVYERTFDPADPEDRKELRGILEAIPYAGPMEFVRGVFNGLFAALGGPDYYHRGRGFQVANSLVRKRRTENRPMVVFIDSNVDRKLLHQAGYTYVGKVSIEAKETLNWDQAYNAAVVESLPWAVDILLVSGGMKGVTVGSNLTFPSIGVGYSQSNYSISAMGGKATGVTEGKGKPVMNADGYRYDPRLARKRQVPGLFYQKLQARQGVEPVRPGVSVPGPGLQPQSGGASAAAPRSAGIEVSPELYEMAGMQASHPPVTIR